MASLLLQWRLAIALLLCLVSYLLYPRTSPLDQSGPSSPRVHLFLPMNKRAIDRDPLFGTRFCKTLLSALVNGYEPIIYNWDLITSTKKTHPAKVFGLADILSTPSDITHIAETDLIVLADALDVWFQLPPAILAERYQNYRRRYADEGKDWPGVIVGAEMRCFPNGEDSAECMAHPPSPLPQDLFSEDRAESLDYAENPRHANAGFAIGTLETMRPVFRKLSDILSSEDYKWPFDQGSFNILLAKGDICVDHYIDLVWNTAYDHDSIAHINMPRPSSTFISETNSTIPYELYPPLGRHRRTGSIPVAMHYNGNRHKTLLETDWVKMWYGSDKVDLQKVVQNRMMGRTIRTLNNTHRTERGEAVMKQVLARDICSRFLPTFDV